MKSSSIKQIGRKFEDWANEQIKEMGLGYAIRTPGSGSGKLKGDSFNALPFLFEFKSERNPSWKGNVRQAREQARIGNYDPDKWILVQRDPETPQANPQAFMVMDYIEGLKLLKKNQAPRIKEPDKEVKWKVKRLIDAARQLLKELE
tara:strand:- start:94 stop:534 length:441 start_codon:yes stop_codon:yes gene_type:complete